MRGIRHQVGKHAQHACHSRQGIAVHARGDGVEQDKGHKAYDKYAEQLQIVVAYKSPQAYLRQIALLILLYQSVAAQKQEYRHTIVAKEGYQVHGQLFVGMQSEAPQLIELELLPGVFVLSHDPPEPVAIVVQHDSQDGDTTHGRTLFS